MPGDYPPPPTTVGEARYRRWREFITGFRDSTAGMVGIGILVFFLVLAILHPILLATVWNPTVYDPEMGYDFVGVTKVVVNEVFDPESQVALDEARLRNFRAQPGDTITYPDAYGFSRDHILGLDPLGRDVLSMVMAGAAPALTMGTTAAITTALVGLALAGIAAYHRGPVDWVITHVSDALLLLPAPILMIILGSSPLGESIGPAMFGAIYGVLMGASATVIILRSHALSIMGQPFIDAARVAGSGARRIILKELVPGMMPLASVYMFVGVTGAIVADAFITFMSYGSGRFNWGTMLYYAVSFPSPHGDVVPWHLLFASGVVISLLEASFYLIGAGIRSVSRVD